MIPTGAARLAGVVGDPIEHSLSPLMMARWLEDAGINGIYAPFHVKAGGLEPFLPVVRAAGLVGLNVTLPHKEAALELSDTASEAARRIGAANLLTFKKDKLHADNTDARGLMNSISSEGVKIKGSQALVLGAGGAARAAVYGLKSSGCDRISITNRTREKAERLVSDMGLRAAVVNWEDRNTVLADTNLIINATSLGLGGVGTLYLDWTQARAKTAVVDTVYTPLRTRFLKDAEAAGLKTIDGLGMLIGQARPSFKAFFGKAPSDDLDIRSILVAALEAGR